MKLELLYNGSNVLAANMDPPNVNNNKPKNVIAAGRLLSGSSTASFIGFHIFSNCATKNVITDATAIIPLSTQKLPFLDNLDITIGYTSVSRTSLVFAFGISHTRRGSAIAPVHSPAPFKESFILVVFDIVLLLLVTNIFPTKVRIRIDLLIYTPLYTQPFQVIEISPELVTVIVFTHG